MPSTYWDSAERWETVSNNLKGMDSDEARSDKAFLMCHLAWTWFATGNAKK